jgi:hypothetical protein
MIPQSLINSACEAEEQFGLDELERYAAEGTVQAMSDKVTLALHHAMRIHKAGRRLRVYRTAASERRMLKTEQAAQGDGVYDVAMELVRFAVTHTREDT